MIGINETIIRLSIKSEIICISSTEPEVIQHLEMLDSLSDNWKITEIKKADGNTAFCSCICPKSEIIIQSSKEEVLERIKSLFNLKASNTSCGSSRVTARAEKPNKRKNAINAKNGGSSTTSRGSEELEIPDFSEEIEEEVKNTYFWNEIEYSR